MERVWLNNKFDIRIFTMFNICMCVCLWMMLTHNGTPNLIETTMQTIHWDWDWVESYVLLLLLLGWSMPYTDQPSLFSAYYVLSYSFFCLRHLCFDHLLIRSLTLCYISLVYWLWKRLTSQHSLYVWAYYVLIFWMFLILFPILAVVSLFHATIGYILHQIIRSRISYDF